jgi:hypothetical protein
MKEKQMGQMAAIAEQHWRTYLPQDYANLTNRETFFQSLEDDAQTQIDQLMEVEEDRTVPGESFADRMGRLRAARQVAEERVFREVLRPEPTEPETPGSPEDADLMAAYEEFQTLREQLPTRDVPQPEE